MLLRRLLIALLALGISGHAPARDSKYIPPDPAAFLALVPPPPDDASPAGQADIDTILQVQADRTPAQVNRANEVNKMSPFSFARAVMGDWLRSKDFPRTKAIFDALNTEADAVINASKQQWNRKRPYARDSRVKLSVGPAGNASYPSGHSASAAVWGAVWSAVFPQRAEAFEAEVREVMWCRVLCGIHYPTDTEAGKLLGEALGAAFLKGPAGKEAVAAMRAEMAAAGKANPPAHNTR